MYMLKVCHCCDAILGELEDHALDDANRPGSVQGMEVRGNVAYSVCNKCMRDMTGDRMYYQ